MSVAPPIEATARLRAAGARVAESRRQAGLTQTQLAERIGASLWAVERIERGELDVERYAAAIAEATDRPESWLLDAQDAVAPEPAAEAAVAAPDEEGAISDRAGRRIVLGSIALLVLIRFFTDITGLLPRAFNFADVPLAFAVCGAALLRARVPAARLRPSFALPAGAFLAVCLLSILANLSRVALPPTLLFLYNFFVPLAFYAAARRLWPPGNVRAAAKLVVALGLIQFFVVVFVDLPKFASTDNPDDISGTFGENAYQLVFFLLVFASLVAGAAVFERGTRTARAAPALIGGALAVIFLAQYRALLVTTGLVVLVVGAFLAQRRGRGIATWAVVLVAFIATLSFVASRFPVTKIAPTIEAFREDPTFFVTERIRAGDHVKELWSDNPQFIPVGTGPGTYSSRAWRVFSNLPRASADVTGPYVEALTGGNIYITDVGDKYLIPQLRSEAVLGSRALTTPFASYFTLLAEVGLLGFLAYVGLYLAALVRAGRLTLAAIRNAGSRDPLPGLCLAVTMALFVLLQMALLENWLEVTRITVPTWILLAIITRETEAKRASAAAPASE